MSTTQSRPEKKEKKSKKRAREEAQEEAAPATTEQSPPKKHKKSKKERQSDAAVVKVEEVESQAEEIVPTKKQKKQKKSHQDGVPETRPEDATSDAPAIADAQLSEKPVESTAMKESQLESKSPFVQQTTSFYLSLSPVAHSFPLEGLCAEHISPLLLTYYPPLKGVVLSFSNPRLSEHPEQGAQVTSSGEAKQVFSKSIDEYAVTYVWLTAEFVIFRPRKGTVLEGYVNLQNESILGLICYNYFNAGIERSRLPKDWQWVEDESAGGDEVSKAGKKGRGAEGYFVDGDGKKVDGRVVFKVKDFEASAGAEVGSGSINIYGSMLSDQNDAELDAELRQKALVRGRPNGR